MFKLFKYIGLFLSAKNLYENPDEVISEFPLAYVQAFFITSGIIILLISMVTLGLGFVFDMLLLKIFGFLFLAVLVAEIIIFFIIIRTIKKLVKRMSDQARNKIFKKGNHPAALTQKGN